MIAVPEQLAKRAYFVHDSAVVDEPCEIGSGTRIWHFSHVMAGAVLGEGCNLGQNVFVAATVRMGRNVKVQNNVSLYDGCILEDDVFCGPSTVFTNVKHPRSAIVKKGEYRPTHVEQGATLGANCTIVCGTRIGKHAFIAAGAVVSRDVPPFSLMAGVPARRKGWVGLAGVPLKKAAVPGVWVCPDTGEKYREVDANTLIPLPKEPAPAEETSPVSMVDLSAQFQTIEAPVRAAVDRVLTSQRFILGEEVDAFERELAATVGAANAVGCASGSDALLLSLMACDLEPGDEVITSPYTFFATGGAIWRLGLKPVFVDVDPQTLTLDPSLLKAAVSEKTRAIIPVHLFGQCADMGGILDFAREHDLTVIEDAAQAIGSRYGDRQAGTMGQMGCFSFFPSKNLGGCGDGGMIVTNDASLASRLKMLAAHGARKKYIHEAVGINSRLDALQAAILRVKLPHLADWSAARRMCADNYRRLFQEQAGVYVLEPVHAAVESLGPQSVMLPVEAPLQYHVYNQFVIRVHAGIREELRAELQRQQIGTEVYYPVPLHLQPCAAGEGYKPGDLPHSELGSLQTLALPIYPELSLSQQTRVVQAISRFFQNREATRAG